MLKSIILRDNAHLKENEQISAILRLFNEDVLYIYLYSWGRFDPFERRLTWERFDLGTF